MRAPLLVPSLALVLAGAAAAQDPNYIRPPDELESRLADAPIRVVSIRDNRWQGDRTQRARVRFQDGLEVEVKWAAAAPGGFAMNNQPRYEVAAYVFQKLFLDEPSWVVPPTVMREVPLRTYRELNPEIQPTFEGTASVLVEVQYWLRAVETEVAPDSARIGTDTAYTRSLATLGLFTHLIRHVDSNPGNILVSTRPPPRLFAVDNGVAFRSPVSPRGTLWRDLPLREVPAAAIRRLRDLTRARLDSALAVVAQFRVREDGRLEAVAPTAKINQNRGVDRQGDIIQFGLTDMELDELWDRIRDVVERVDAGELEVF